MNCRLEKLSRFHTQKLVPFERAFYSQYQNVISNYTNSSNLEFTKSLTKILMCIILPGSYICGSNIVT